MAGRLRPAVRARGLRALVVLAVVSLGLTLILAERLEHSPVFRDPLYGDKFRKLTAAMRDRDCDRPILFLGSSRVEYGFRSLDAEQGHAQPTDAVVNFGFPGGGPLLLTVHAERLLQAGIRPKMVLIEYLPALLHGRSDGPAESGWFTADRFTHAERTSLRSWIGHDTPMTASAINPWPDGRIAFFGRFAPWLMPARGRAWAERKTDARGWLPYRFPPRTEEERSRLFERTRSEYGASLADLHPTGPAATAFASLVRRFGDTPVRIVLMPESSAYRGLYGPHTEHAILDFVIGLDVPWTDARDWVPDRHFADGHHLLTEGAAMFTDRLFREVRP
jgi:hypothetical protein